MKKTLIFLIFSAAAIFYSVDYIVPYFNDGRSAASEVLLQQVNPGSSTSDEFSESRASDDNATNVTDQPDGHSLSTVDKPLEPAIRNAVRELVNTSHEGLVTEKTDNGVMVNLKGRFRTAPVATISEDGVLTVRDYTAPPPE